MLLITGCASVAPLMTGVSPELFGNGSDPPPLSTTLVRLTKANFHVEKLNVIGESSGFKLLGIFTIVPPSRVKAFSRMYKKAGLQPGSPLAPAHIVVEYIDNSFILFSIPNIYVRADFVCFDNAVNSHGNPGNDHEVDAAVEPAAR